MNATTTRILLTTLGTLGLTVTLIGAANALLGRGGQGCGREPAPPEPEVHVVAEEVQDPAPEADEEQPEAAPDEEPLSEEEPADQPESKAATEQDAAAPDPPQPEPADASAAEAAPSQSAATAAPAAPAPPVEVQASGTTPYEMRFASDDDLGSLILDATVEVYACGRTGLYLVPVAREGVPAGVAKVADDCDRDVRVRHGLRSLERPTPSLQAAMRTSGAGYRWFVAIDDDLASRIDEQLATLRSSGDRKALVEIHGDRSVKVVPQ